MVKKRKVLAQSVVEYLLVFAGITLAILFGVKLLSGSAKDQQSKANSVLNTTNSKLGTAMGLENGTN